MIKKSCVEQRLTYKEHYLLNSARSILQSLEEKYEIVAHLDRSKVTLTGSSGSLVQAAGQELSSLLVPFSDVSSEAERILKERSIEQHCHPADRGECNPDGLACDCVGGKACLF